MTNGIENFQTISVRARRKLSPKDTQSSLNTRTQIQHKRAHSRSYPDFWQSPASRRARLLLLLLRRPEPVGGGAKKRVKKKDDEEQEARTRKRSETRARAARKSESSRHAC